MWQSQSPVPAWLQILQAGITLSAAAIAGIWAIIKVVKRREHSPRIEFQVGAEFVGRQGDSWLVECVAQLNNKGIVRLDLSDFYFDLRIMQGSDPVEEGDSSINLQVNIPNKVKRANWIPKGWVTTFIEPGVSTRYSYISSVPAVATFVLVHGTFVYTENNNRHTSSKLVAVPKSDDKNLDG